MGRGSRRRGATRQATIAEMVDAAVHTWDVAPDVHAAVLDRLDGLAERGQPVLATVRPAVDTALQDLWRHGWTPVDAVHVTARRLSAHHAAAVSDAIVRNAEHDAGPWHDPRWQAQLDLVRARQRGRRRDGVSTVRVVVTVLCLLLRLPPVPPVLPGPGASHDDPDGVPASRLDPRMLARVRALLAKAESTEFEEEAEALTAKAQELIARHAISDALLHTPDDVGEPSARRILLDDPYVDAKAALLSVVAGANRCRAVYSADLAWVTVFGYDRDLDAIELLGASLLAQATRAMARHGSRRDARGRSTTRSFRRAFLLGFANRIGERLRAASDDAAQQTARADHARLLPVLAARDDRVRAAVTAAFPELESRTTSVSNAAGWVAGRAAADLATITVASGRLDGRTG